MTYAFDTLKFTQRLEQVGVGREQAEAHAELARDMILADVATKADLLALETALKSDIASLGAAFRMEITGVRTDARADTSGLKADIQIFKKEFEGSLRELELRMTVKLGAMMAAAVAAIAALQKFL